jgi:hypothetical protein
VTRPQNVLNIIGARYSRLAPVCNNFPLRRSVWWAIQNTFMTPHEHAGGVLPGKGYRVLGCLLDKRNHSQERRSRMGCHGGVTKRTLPQDRCDMAILRARTSP